MRAIQLWAQLDPGFNRWVMHSFNLNVEDDWVTAAAGHAVWHGLSTHVRQGDGFTSAVYAGNGTEVRNAARNANHNPYVGWIESVSYTHLTLPTKA